ncbi:MAG: C45 family autoproteolytic acyltransferase/hydrolase [Planctomycetota bacterium]|jgi:hypothetical protein
MSTNRRTSRAFVVLAALLLLVIVVEPHAAGSVGDEESALHVRERTVAGGAPGDFMHVRHLVLRGTNYDIGRHLARLARDRHGAGPSPSTDPAWTRAQLSYFTRYWPQHVSRMRGVAAQSGGDLADPATNFASLGYGYAGGGCSVVYYPPTVTAAGTGVLSRNFDFTTGTFDGRRPQPDQVAICGAPYVIEMYPDDGYPSLFVCCYDLLSGAIDGVNAKGLTVALLADDELMRDGSAEPVPGARSGFGVVEITRYLLDTCATVEEARAALLEAKLYYGSIPCHYIIADAHGRSFVWENSRTLNRGYVIEGSGEPQITTNFMLHRHMDVASMPEDGHPRGSFTRFRAMRERIDGRTGPMDLDDIKATNACVAADLAAPRAPIAPGRTLWHALYFPEERRMQIDFYLGEDDATPPTIRRSGYLEFTLEDQSTGRPLPATARPDR